MTAITGKNAPEAIEAPEAFREQNTAPDIQAPDVQDGKDIHQGAGLDAIKERLNLAEAHRAQQTGRNKRAGLPAEAAALMGRVATEMVAGLAVGGFMGWGLDRLFGTTPIFMIVLFFAGGAAGMMNIWRMAMGHGLKVGYFDRKDLGRKNLGHGDDESHGHDKIG